MNKKSKNLTVNALSIIQTAHSAHKDLMQGISTLREHIGKLQARREEILSIGITQDAAEARVDEWIDAVVRRSLSMTIGNYHLPPEKEKLLVSPKSWNMPETDLLLLLGVYFKDDLAGAIKEKLAELYAAGRNQISEDDRAEQLSAVEQELFDAEIGEESIIRSAERSGFKISRRADADPRAVLADAGDLP